MKTIFTSLAYSLLFLLFTVHAHAQLSVSANITIGNCNNNGIITATITGESLPVSYELLDQAGNIIRTTQSSPVFNALLPGIYRVKATDNITSALSNAVELKAVRPALQAKVKVALLPCNGSLGTIEVNVNGGLAPYTYQILSGPQVRPLQSSNIFNNLGIGNYLVRVIDACGISVDVNASLFRASVSEVQPEGGQGYVTFRTSFDCESGIGIKIRAGWKYRSNDAWLAAADASLYTWKIEYPAGTGIFYGANGAVGGPWAPLSQLFIPLPSLSLAPLLSANIVLRDACGTLKRFTTSASNLLSLNPGNCSNDGLLNIEAGDISLICLPVTHTITNLSTLAIQTHVQASANLVIPGLTPLSTYLVTSVDSKGKILLTNLLITIPALSNGFPVSTTSIASACTKKTGTITPDSTSFRSGKIIYTILQAPIGSGITLPYTDTVHLGEAIKYNGNDQLPAGNYQVQMKDSCRNGTVSLNVKGYDPVLEKIEASGSCTRVSLLVKGTVDQPGAYELVIMPGSAAAIGYTRDWLNTTSSLPFNNLPYGSYKIGIRVKGKSCILDSLAISFSTENILKIDTLNTGGYTCAGSPTGGKLTVNMQKAVFPPIEYRYELTPGSGNFSAWQAGKTFSGLSTGTYLVQVRDLCGNTDSYHAQVIDGGNITASVNASLICEGDSLRLNVDAVAALSYSWTGPNGFTSNEKSPLIPVVSALAQGLYTVVVSTLACPDITVSVNVNISLQPLLVINLPIISVCLGANIDLTLPLVTLGSAPGLVFSYFKDSQGTIPLLNPSAVDSAGTYYIKATNANGCSIIKPINVLLSILPTASITYGGSIFCLSGLLPVTQSGQAGGTYSGSPGLSINVNTGLINLGASIAGTHTVIYTYSNGTCTNTDTTIINIGILPPILNGGSGSICVGSKLNLSNPILLGTWSSSNPAVATVHPQTGVVTGVSAGTAVITYSLNLILCLNTSSVTVTVHALPEASISYAGSPYCASGMAAVTLSGQAGGTFSSSPGIILNPATGAIDLQASTPGTYTIMYKFSNGVCADSTSTSVAIRALPTAGISYSGSPFCASGTVSVLQTGQSGGVYSATEGLVIDSASGTINLSASSAGNHVVSYTFSDGTCSNSVTAFLTIEPTPGVAPISGPLFICVGSGVMFSNDSTGGTWSSTNPAIASINTTSGAATGLSVGTTSIIYTINNGVCSASDTLLLTVGTPVSVDPISGPTEVCSGSSVVLSSNPAGGIWSSSNTAIATVDNGGTVSGISAGNVTITYIVGAPECSDSSSVTINVRQAPVASISYGASLFCKQGSVQVVLTGQGGGTYSAAAGLVISSSTGEINLATSSAGTYTINYNFSDGNCGGIAFTIITINDDPTLVVTAPAASCGSADLTDPSITDGSDAGLTFMYYTDQAGNITLNNPDSVTQNGTYYIQGISVAGCRSGILPVQVSILQAPVVPAINGPSSLRTGATANLSNSMAGGVWSSSNSSVLSVTPSGLVTGISAGTATISYTVTGTNGCTGQANLVIQVGDTTDLIGIPNIISPNGDGKNDLFVISGLNAYEGASLEIYNRWGDMLYRSENYQNNWGGEGLSSGTYFYIIKLRTSDGDKAYNGWVFIKL